MSASRNLEPVDRSLLTEIMNRVLHGTRHEMIRIQLCDTMAWICCHCRDEEAKRTSWTESKQQREARRASGSLHRHLPPSPHRPDFSTSTACNRVDYLSADLV